MQAAHSVPEVLPGRLHAVSWQLLRVHTRSHRRRLVTPGSSMIYAAICHDETIMGFAGAHPGRRCQGHARPIEIYGNRGASDPGPQSFEAPISPMPRSRRVTPNAGMARRVHVSRRTEARTRSATSTARTVEWPRPGARLLPWNLSTFGTLKLIERSSPYDVHGCPASVGL